MRFHGFGPERLKPDRERGLRFSKAYLKAIEVYSEPVASGSADSKETTLPLIKGDPVPGSKFLDFSYTKEGASRMGIKR